MSWPKLLLLSAVEIIGDFGYKKFADDGGIIPFLVGTIGYIGVVVSLIISLRGSTVLMVNGAWDGISTILESIMAYVILGERFESIYQYLGIALICLGLYFLKIPFS